MLKTPFSALLLFCLPLVLVFPLTTVFAQDDAIYRGNVGGYTSVGKERVDETYDAGYSMYSAAWPLLPEYPGHQFQSGLFGTWLGVQNDRPSPIERFYTKIEGGLGWWRDTEYPTETPKFIMGGVELNFRGWANGPGAGQGRDWSNPKGKNGKWVVVAAEDVPAETGLHAVDFSRPKERPPKTYVTPDDAQSCWKTPGPVAGPFEAHPGDGSVVTYFWYRFADQPALLNADLTDQERETLQKRVEKLHRHWTKGRDYLAPPTVGTLAHIAPALIVTPPSGMEVGYVPIATRQGARKAE